MVNHSQKASRKVWEAACSFYLALGRLSPTKYLAITMVQLLQLAERNLCPNFLSPEKLSDSAAAGRISWEVSIVA